MRGLRFLWWLLKRALYLVFGILAFGFGLILTGWIFYNLLLPVPDAAFEATLPKEPVFRFLRILTGFVVAFMFGCVGLFWMAKAGVAFRRLELWRRK